MSIEGRRDSERSGMGGGGASYLDGTSDPSSDEALRFIHRYGPKSAPAGKGSSGQPEPSDRRSALSAPQNFIAEGAISRFLNRVMGRRRWPLVLFGMLAVAGSLAGLVATDRVSIADLMRAVAPAGTDNQAGLPQPAASQPGPAASAAAGGASPAQSDADLQRRLEHSAPSGSGPGPTGFETRMSGFPLTVAPLNVPPPVSDKPDNEDAAAGPGDPSEVTGTVKADPPAAAAAPRPEDTEKLDALIARGQQLLDSGEVAAARLFFERAAGEGDPRGALGVAKSYNERVLRTLPVVGLRGNSAEAERWYRKAAELEGRRGATGNR